MPKKFTKEEVEAALADVRKEQSRQLEYAGERVGVFRRLRELEAQERKLVRCLEGMQANPTGAYA